MTITVNLHRIAQASCDHHNNFSVVTIRDENDCEVALFLGAGKGQDIADAINAAVAKPTADEVAA